MIYEIPIKIESSPNKVACHYGIEANRRKEQRSAAFLLTRSAMHGLKYYPGEDLHLIVRIARVASRDLDDDNLAASMKSIRDGITDALHRKNDRKNFTWFYTQIKSKRGVYSVIVDITEKKEEVIDNA